MFIYLNKFKRYTYYLSLDNTNDFEREDDFSPLESLQFMNELGLNGEDFIDDIFKQDLIEEITQIIHTFNERDSYILNHGFGLTGYEYKKQVEIGSELSIAQPNISKKTNDLIKKSEESYKKNIIKN